MCLQIQIRFLKKQLSSKKCEIIGCQAVMYGLEFRDMILNIHRRDGKNVDGGFVFRRDNVIVMSVLFFSPVGMERQSDVTLISN